MWLSDIKFVMLEMFPETQVSIIFYFGHRPLEILFQIFFVDSMFVYTQKRNIERMQMKKQKINYQVICFCQWFLAGKKVFIFYMMLWWGICFYPLLLFLWTFCKMQLNFEDQMSQKSIDRSNLIEDEKQIPKKRKVQQGAEVQKEKGLGISIWERSSRFIWFVDFSIPWTLHPKDWKVFAWRNLPPSSLQMTQLGRVCIGKKGFYGIFS